jgi:hypothetical protein
MADRHHQQHNSHPLPIRQGSARAQVRGIIFKLTQYPRGNVFRKRLKVFPQLSDARVNLDVVCARG